MPAHCVLCASATRSDLVCPACDELLPRLAAARCRVCALPLPHGDTCGECLAHAPAFDGIEAPYAYAFPVTALIQAYKYAGHLSLGRVLSGALAREPLPPIDALIAMPLAPARLRERGFNQAQELARDLGRALGVPVLRDACRKVTDGPPQAALPWTERARNVRGAFVCDADLTGRRVAIVDDVMTTGATLNELAKNLKRAGASEVRGFVVARTLRSSAQQL